MTRPRRRHRYLAVLLGTAGALVGVRPGAPACAADRRAADALPTVAVVLKSAERADKKLDKIARNLSSLVEVFLSAEGLGVLKENGAVRLVKSKGSQIANAQHVAAFNGNLWISEYINWCGRRRAGTCLLPAARMSPV